MRQHMQTRTEISRFGEPLESELPDDIREVYEKSREKAAATGEKFIPMNEREIVALIAYIQRLGTDIKVKETSK